jgi:hypothetical protein
VKQIATIDATIDAMLLNAAMTSLAERIASTHAAQRMPFVQVKMILKFAVSKKKFRYHTSPKHCSYSTQPTKKIHQPYSPPKCYSYSTENVADCQVIVLLAEIVKPSPIESSTHVVTAVSSSHPRRAIAASADDAVSNQE